MSFEFEAFASELEACVPQAALDAGAAPLSDLLTKVFALIEALKAKDAFLVGQAIYNLLGLVYGPAAGTEPETISFQQMALGSGVNWERILGIIERILPLILKIA